jgi:hypothetical protein
MLAALIAGQRDPEILAQYARGRLRGRLAELEEAFTGRFNGHHAFLLSKMLARVDQVDTDLDDLDARIEAEVAPFAQAAARLDEIPGVGHDTACVIVSEIGIDMSRFPTAAHLCSSARFAPGSNNPPAAAKETGPPGTAIAILPGSSVKRRSAPEGPTPSLANATDASLDDEGRRRPSSRSVDLSW